MKKVFDNYEEKCNERYMDDNYHYEKPIKLNGLINRYSNQV